MNSKKLMKNAFFLAVACGALASTAAKAEIQTCRSKDDSVVGTLWNDDGSSTIYSASAGDAIRLGSDGNTYQVLDVANSSESNRWGRYQVMTLTLRDSSSGSNLVVECRPESDDRHLVGRKPNN